jgi:DNA-binding CsgD family transcriptional regulator/tetratricopeptide (TPR) repeat protein
MRPVAVGQELLERSHELAALRDALAAVRADGRGRLVIVAGESGIGKTTLLRTFCDGARSARVLWGACDALHTPRPLGPLLDMVDDFVGDAGALGKDGATPGAVLAALAGELRRRSPSIVVFEDLHWADEATLDLLRLLGRRVESLPALVLATFRDDELDRAHPLRIVLGELPARPVRRMPLSRLSEAAVGALTDSVGIDAAEVYRITGGNPFFVTEVISAGGDGVPATVRDAVLARAARLRPGARALLDAAGIVPPHVEIWLLEAMADEQIRHLDDCLGSGMLVARGDAVGFRHEIARVAIEEALPPHTRVELHRRALAGLVAAPERHPDRARLAYHAEATGDAAAVCAFAPLAAERAAALGAHREAAAQFARALRFAHSLPAEERAALLERRSYECYLTDLIPQAIEARREALELHRARGDRLRQGDAHRWLSRLAWFQADHPLAEEEAARAVELLEGLPEGRELAMAYSNKAQLRMLATDLAGAREWGARAIALAERLGESEILAHALNNVGTAELQAGLDAGVPKLERSLQLARAAGSDEHVARAYTNLGSTGFLVRGYAFADQVLDAGIAYCQDRDLDSWRLYMLGCKALSSLEQGRWDEAADCASGVLRHPGVAASHRIYALCALGQVRARRGDPDPWGPLDEVLELARRSTELQCLTPVLAARADAHWLAGEERRIGAETEEALEQARALANPWALGELCVWRRRAGLHDEVRTAGMADHHRLELAGEWQAAAEAWRAFGRPYEAALALAEAPDVDALRRSHADLQAMGARPAAARVARALRERGARGLRLGPRTATRGNPAGLTRRELEVLRLVAEGLRNADIAAQLFLSAKTVDHHVSAILRKLGVQTRGQAGAAAARLGIVEK